MSSVRSPVKQAYFEQVWEFVRQVPYGKVVTYGQIAQALPKPESLEPELEVNSVSQLVGHAMAACPDDVPWHRVVSSQGKVSSWSNASEQQRLLETEGVLFYGDRLSLDECQWYGDYQDGEPQQHSLF